MTTVTQTGITVETAIEQALHQLNVSREEVEIEILDEGRKGFLGFGAREAKVQVSLKSTATTPDLPIAEETTVGEDQKKGLSPEEATIIDAASEENLQTATGPSAATVSETVEAKEEKRPVSTGIDPITAATDYLINVAKEMGIHDLTVSSEEDGKYVYFQLESEKAALLIGKRGQTLHALQLLSQLVANQYADSFKVLRINVGDYRQRREESLERLANRMADKAVSSNRKVQLEPMLAYERKVIHNALSNRLDIETYSEGTEPHRYLVIEPMR